MVQGLLEQIAPRSKSNSSPPVGLAREGGMEAFVSWLRHAPLSRRDPDPLSPLMELVMRLKLMNNLLSRL